MAGKKKGLPTNAESKKGQQPQRIKDTPVSEDSTAGPRAAATGKKKMPGGGKKK